MFQHVFTIHSETIHAQFFQNPVFKCLTGMKPSHGLVGFKLCTFFARKETFEERLNKNIDNLSRNLLYE